MSQLSQGAPGPQESVPQEARAPEVASLYGGPATKRVRTRDLRAAKELVESGRNRKRRA